MAAPPAALAREPSPTDLHPDEARRGTAQPIHRRDDHILSAPLPISALPSFKQVVVRGGPALFGDSAILPSTIKEVIKDTSDATAVFPFVCSANSISITIDDDYYRNRVNSCSPLLTFRLLLNSGQPPLTVAALIANLKSLWNVPDLSIAPLGRGFFNLMIQDASKRAALLKKCYFEPSFGKVRVLRWSPAFNPYKANTTTAFLWIRIFELPFELWTERVLRSIAAAIGVPLKLDDRALNGSLGHFVRVLIDVDMMDFSFPTSIVLHTSTLSFQVSIGYEHVPSFCSCCLSLGHSVMECRRQQHPSKRADGTGPHPPQPRQRHDKSGTRFVSAQSPRSSSPRLSREMAAVVSRGKAFVSTLAPSLEGEERSFLVVQSHRSGADFASSSRASSDGDAPSSNLLQSGLNMETPPHSSRIAAVQVPVPAVVATSEASLAQHSPPTACNDDFGLAFCLAPPVIAQTASPVPISNPFSVLEVEDDQSAFAVCSEPLGDSTQPPTPAGASSPSCSLPALVEAAPSGPHSAEQAPTPSLTPPLDGEVRTASKQQVPLHRTASPPRRTPLELPDFVPTAPLDVVMPVPLEHVETGPGPPDTCEDFPPLQQSIPKLKGGSSRHKKGVTIMHASKPVTRSQTSYGGRGRGRGASPSFRPKDHQNLITYTPPITSQDTNVMDISTCVDWDAIDAILPQKHGALFRGR